jgi:AraC-like DNA-binding protein
MSAPATTLTSWLLPLRKVLEARGVEAAPLFAAAGLDASRLSDPDARYPHAQASRLWALAVAATGDEALGLALPLQLSPTTFHALGYALAASGTLREVFTRVEQGVGLVSDALRLSVREVGAPAGAAAGGAGEGRLAVALEPVAEPLAWEELDAVAAVVVRGCRVLQDRTLSPLEVRLRRPPPADPAPFAKVFRAPLRFGAEADVLLFPRAPFEAPLPGANPELARICAEAVARHLAQRRQGDVAAQVRALLIELLPQGEPSQERVALRLHMSARSLQRRLVEAGSGFRELLAETRRSLAVSYLAEPGRSVSEIAYLLGFSDVSTFTRAFRRWTGRPPSRWEARRAEEGPRA